MVTTQPRRGNRTYLLLKIHHVQVLNPIVLSNNLVADHFVRSWKLSSFWQEPGSRLDSIVEAKKKQFNHLIIYHIPFLFFANEASSSKAQQTAHVSLHFSFVMYEMYWNV